MSSSYLNLTSCGYLNIVLIEGTRLPKTDFISRSDPFVYLYVRQRKDLIKRSSVKQNNQEPVWNEQFYLEVCVVSLWPIMSFSKGFGSFVF